MLQIVGIASIVFGIWLLWIHRDLISLGWRSRRWTPSSATVIDSTDASFVIDSVNEFSSATQTKYSEREYAFRYHVLGRQYISNSDVFGGHVDRMGTDFMIGDHVTIYFDPHNPSRAVVKRGVRFSACFGIVFVCVGAFLIYSDMLE